MVEKIIIKQIRSRIGTKPKQKATLTALGLRKIGVERVHIDSPEIRGMIERVKHLVSVKKL